MKLHKIVSTIVLGAAAFTMVAGPIDEARKLYHNGEYEAVLEKLKTAIKRQPKDGNVTFFYGASLYALGRVDEAIKPLTVAEGRGVAQASQILTEIALDRYDAASASAHLDEWAEMLEKKDKETPAVFDELSARAMMMSNMLDRVERIEVIDSLSVDSATFFSYYRLSSAAGRILPPDAVSRLGAGVGQQELSVAYMPENRSELLWAAADSTGNYRLYSADILDDGTIDHTIQLDESLCGGGDAIYPFLMPDGMTLYFASDGENSLGGYDIFMTRRTDSADGGKEFYQPQNVGMPYNSPYNDYLLAIDETSGLGWWATDRSADAGRVTIYVFIPSQMRVNVEPGDPNLASLARLDNISLTQKADVDYRELLGNRLPPEDVEISGEFSKSPTFALDMGNGKVYYRLSDFKNERAKAAMLEALATESGLRKHLIHEENLRSRYSKGDKSVASAILESEAETARLRARFASQRNDAVRLETRN